MNRLLFLTLLLIISSGTSLFAQFSTYYSYIEVRGLTKETQEEFISRLDHVRPADSFATIETVVKEYLGYTTVNYVLYPDPSNPALARIVINVRDDPETSLKITPEQRRHIPIPDEWKHLAELSRNPAGETVTELGLLHTLIDDYEQGNFVALGVAIRSMNRMSSGIELMIDSTRVIRLLQAVHDLQNFDRSRTGEIILYADDPFVRKLAGTVLLNQRNDLNIVRLLISALWDSKGAQMIAVNVLNESLQKNRYDFWKQVEPKPTPEEVGALLNNPDIPIYEIGVQILRLPDTPAEFAIAALSKGGLSVEESLQSKMEGMKFSAKTVSFLRIVTKKNLGDDPLPWIEWLRSIRK